MKLNYIVLGTNQMEKAVGFYNQLFDGQNFQQMPTDRMHYFLGDGFAFALAVPFDQKEATHGNGSMIGFEVESQDEVIRLHQLAIELGGTDEGEPSQKGPRFSAYVRDLDHNKICFSV